MGVSKDESASNSERDSEDDKRKVAIRAFVLAHFELEPGTGVLVPVCSEAEFRENLNVKIDPATFEPDFDSCSVARPLIASKDEWRLALVEFRKVNRLTPKPILWRAIARMQLTRNTDDWLASFGEQNPASLTMVGERALQRWEATADAFQLELAKKKYRLAAEYGDSQAAYRLATCVIIDVSIEPKRGRSHSTPLESDSALRRKYERRAALSGHPVVRQKLEENLETDTQMASSNGDIWLEEAKKDLAEIDRDLHRWIPLADNGSTAAQLEVAKLLGKKCKLYDVASIFLASRAEVEEFEALMNLQASYLRSAATDQPEARYLLVSEGIERDEEEVPKLLRSAAFPRDGETSFPKALVRLAGCLTQTGELSDAEQCLRLAIKQGVEARLELADLLHDHADRLSEKASEAIALYEAIVAPYDEVDSFETWGEEKINVNVLCRSARAALRAGLAFYRGIGVSRDFQRAKRLFEAGAATDVLRRRSAHSFDPESIPWRADPDSFYCELAFQLGWGGNEQSYAQYLRDANQVLFARLTSLQFNVEPGDVVCVSDVLSLVNQRHESEDLSEKSNTFLDATNDDDQEGEYIQFVALIRMLSEPSLTRDELVKWLRQGEQVGNPESLLLLAWANATDRFGDIDLDSARRLFTKAKSSANQERRDTWWRVDGMTETETRHERLVIEAERGLRRCADVQNARQIASREAEKAIEEANRKALVESARREAGEDMMAMFTHKFRGPVDSILFNTSHHMEPRVFADAARTMNGLLDIFSLVSTTPGRLIANLQEDRTGSGSPERVLVHSLKLALIQLLSQRNRRRLLPHYLAYAKRNFKAPADLKVSVWSSDGSWQAVEHDLQLRWESDVGGLVAAGEFTQLAAWMDKHIIPIQMDGFPTSSIRFAEYGPYASVLTVVFTEVLVNAIKHSEPSALSPILLSWDESSELAVFRCTNPSTQDSRRREASKGSGRGHKFLNTIAGHVHGTFKTELQNQPSSVTFSIPLSVLHKA